MEVKPNNKRNDEIQMTNDELNSKSEILNPKQAPNSNDQNSKQNKASFQDAKRATTGSLHSKKNV
jgi:hypothetical protein